MNQPLVVRPITADDDAAMAQVIRTVMPEFGASGPGFAINDPEVDHLSAAFDLIASDADRFVELVFAHESQKLA